MESLCLLFEDFLFARKGLINNSLAELRKPSDNGDIIHSINFEASKSVDFLHPAAVPSLTISAEKQTLL